MEPKSLGRMVGSKFYPSELNPRDWKYLRICNIYITVLMKKEGIA